ncbi:ABC transporter permease subunit [Nocardioides salsibiostraticola]
MTTDTTGPTDQTEPTDNSSDSDRSRRDAWAVSWSGTRLVMELEIRQRFRSTRWRIGIAVVFALIAGVALLTIAAAQAVDASEGDAVFGLIVFFVLFMGLLVSPTLSAGSINGDAKEGTLAPLQSTPLSAADIVLGKLLASWIASLVLLALAMPFIGLGFFTSEARLGALATVVIVLAVELLVVCAFGLGWSALTSGTAASTVLTYLTIAVLVAILPVFFGLFAALWTTNTTETYEFPQYYDKKSAPPNAQQDRNGQFYVCRTESYNSNEPRTDRLWWLLAVNPFVIVADSAPTPEQTSDEYYSSNGILDSLKYAVREARLGPDSSMGSSECTDQLSSEEIDRQNRRDNLSALWPWGIGAQMLLSAGALYIAVQRVRVPYRKLSAGSRVA